MAQVRYLAPKPSYRRIMRPEDMARFGVEIEAPLVFEKSNNWTLEMDDAACETLVSKLPDEFIILGSPTIELEVTEDAGNSSDASIIDESGADDPQDDPDSSLSEADVMVNESPGERRRKR